MKLHLITLSFALLASVISAQAKERVKTDSGCTVVLDEAPPSQVSVRWSGSCSGNGLANGAGTLQISGGEMLPYSETGRLERGVKIGTWFREYETIGVELKWTYLKNLARGVDVYKVKNYSPAREKQAYAFMSKVVSEGDFASPVALGISQVVSSNNTPSAGDPGRPAVTSTPAPTMQQSRNPSSVTISRPNCPPSVQVVQDQYVNTFSYAGNGIVSFRNNFGIVSENWNSIDAALENFKLNERLEQEKARNRSSCSGKDPFGRPAPCPTTYPPADYTRAIEWVMCYRNGLSASAGQSTNTDSAMLDNITPQIPGCPRYLRKSLVTWRQVGNPQLNTWEIRNVSNRTVKVSYREGGETGSASSPDTLPPGNATQVGLVNAQVPPYVVRDFEELMAFNQDKENSRKVLQCELSIRPR